MRVAKLQSACLCNLLQGLLYLRYLYTAFNRIGSPVFPLIKISKQYAQVQSTEEHKPTICLKQTEIEVD